MTPPQTPSDAPSPTPSNSAAVESDDPAITKLFAVLLAGEHAAFSRLISESRMAPDVMGRVAMARMIGSEVGHYEQLASYVSARGIDPIEAVERHGEVFDRYHRSTTPTTWYETLIKIYIGDGLAADFYIELADVLPEGPRELLAEVMSETGNSEFAREQVRAAVARTPDLASPLTLWGRRLLGEAITHAQWVLAEEEDVTDLLFAGASSLQGVAGFFESVEASHARRMTDLGLGNVTI